MTSIRITLSKKTEKILEQKRTIANETGDIRLFKRVSAIFGFGHGHSIREVARLLDVASESVRSWISQFLEKGERSLQIKKSSGRPNKLTHAQKKKLSKTIEGGPGLVGYPGACWRSPMIQNFIQTEFKVFYSVAYIAQLLKNMGFSFQKAKFESFHHDEKKRKEWLENTWPAIQKKAKNLGALILFGDEASFPQWGSLSYTWSPIGQTPIVKTSGKRKGYKVFGLIEYSTGKFFSQAQEGRLTTAAYLHFLEDVLEKTDEHLLIIQDGAKYHTSVEAMQFFDDNSDRMTVYQLPTYSPDYNPIEALWKKIKQTGTHLHYFPTFESLTEKVDLMLGLFEKEAKEVLKLFGFYNNLSLATV
jgi:transposase